MLAGALQRNLRESLAFSRLMTSLLLKSLKREPVVETGVSGGGLLNDSSGRASTSILEDANAECLENQSS